MVTELSIFEKERKISKVEVLILGYRIAIENGKWDLLDITDEVNYQNKARCYDEISEISSYSPESVRDFLSLMKNQFFAYDRFYNTCQNQLIPVFSKEVILLGEGG